ncbi:MAG: hypothetical protein A2049_11085 [Elusimicrobia bacterium GWA2_62_23]|nr:MAG: hypothetical protein A2049_11085 [Elusimicrobia bacterium GWA2_62_23]OGR68971.1 MAG: hypothetical protein A2179_00275 [Elusimicrobia bacterium GWC2_63_65]
MKKLLIIAAALLISAGTVDAKWWIFGKSKAEVGLKYLHINGVSADETGPKIKLFREMLGADGLVKISGRASGGQIGSVRLTLDDKATWTEVKLAANGTFEQSFKPEAGRTYALLIEVTDTAGKMNKPEETRKELTLSEENVQARVREALDALFQAYNAEDLRKFMAGVGENFAADKGILERAVKRDFDALSAINLRYTLNNVAAGAQGRVFASITFNRMVMVNKSGQTSTDSGSTEFVFDSKEGKLSLFSMKQPLMFGLSDAENVAIGQVLGGGEGLVIGPTGELGGDYTNDSFTDADGVASYDFDMGTEDQSPAGIGCGNISSGHVVFNLSGPSIYPASGALVQEIPGKNISSVTLADVQAITGTCPNDNNSGKTYGIKSGGANYAMEVVSITGAGPYSVSIKFRKF